MKANRNVIVVFTLLIFIGFSVEAVVIFPFAGWKQLIEQSPDIVVARCTVTSPEIETDSDGVILERRDGLIDSDLRVFSSLKGELTNVPIRLRSRYWPRQNEDYLLFGHFTDGVFHAYEEYRVVPLGIGFPTNSLTGKSLDVQVKFILQWRLNRLNKEMKQGQEEKQRFEEGLN